MAADKQQFVNSGFTRELSGGADIHGAQDAQQFALGGLEVEHGQSGTEQVVAPAEGSDSGDGDRLHADRRDHQ